MQLSDEQLQFLAKELLLSPFGWPDGYMTNQQEKIYLLEQPRPDPKCMASLVLFECLPLKKCYYLGKTKKNKDGEIEDENFLEKMHKQDNDTVEGWLVAVWHWYQAHRAELTEYQMARRWHGNRRSPDLNPKWKQFKELATEMTKEWKTCMCCSTGGNVHIDHVQPERLGGSFYNLKNIQVLCHTCNIRKSSTEKDHRNDTFKKHVAEFCDLSTRAYQMMLCTPEPSKAWLSSQPIKMRRVMHKSVA